MKKYLNFTGLLFIILLSLFHVSCKYNDVVVGDIEGVKLGKTNPQNISLNVNIQVSNPNNYKIKIKRYDFIVNLNNQDFKLKNYNANIVIPKRYKGTLSVPVNIKNIGRGFMSIKTLLLISDLMKNNSVQVNIDGSIEASVFIIMKTIHVHEKRTIKINKNK